MLVPSQPSDPQRPSSALSAGTPRPATTDSGLTPPLVPPAELPDDPDLDEREDAPARAAETSAPRRPRLGPPPCGKSLAPLPDNISPGLTAEQRMLFWDTYRITTGPRATSPRWSATTCRSLWRLRCRYWLAEIRHYQTRSILALIAVNPPVPSVRNLCARPPDQAGVRSGRGPEG